MNMILLLPLLMMLMLLLAALRIVSKVLNTKAEVNIKLSRSSFEIHKREEKNTS